MKNYSDSDYTLNKINKTDIVYRFVNDVVEITVADYLTENPKKTKYDFCKWKSWSDDDYMEQDKSDYNQTRKNLQIHEIDETELGYIPSPEELLVDEIEAIEEEKKRRQLLKKAKRALNELTNIQRRRYLMYYVEKLTMRQIANIEGTNHKSVEESLQAAEKKIRNFIMNI